MSKNQLRIALYDGDFNGDMTSLVHICDIEGSLVPDGRPPYGLLEEALRVLEICAEKHATPRPRGDCITVFIGRKANAAVCPCARLDVFAHNGEASASVMSRGSPRWDTQPVRYAPDDNVVAIVRKILEGKVRARG